MLPAPNADKVTDRTNQRTLLDGIVESHGGGDDTLPMF